MTNRGRAAHHLNMAAQTRLFGRADDEAEIIRWHLFQARFARLQDVMSPAEAFPNAVHWSGDNT